MISRLAIAIEAFSARSSAPTGERVAWVDAAKGICIILVVMMHSTLGLGEATGREGWLHQVVEFARPFRIPAFFLLSGLFLARTIDQPWRRYFDRKVLHFVYFYLLWTVIQATVKTLPKEGMEDLLREFALALVEPFGTLWFIYLLPIFFVVTKLSRRAPIWLVMAEAIALNLWPHETGWTAVDEFMRRYVFFFAGYAFAPALFALAEQARRAPDIVAAASGVCFALIAAATFGFDAPSMAPIHQPILALLLGGAGAGALIASAAALAPTRVGRAIRYCGEHSLAIYLAFFLPMAATRMLLIKLDLIGVLIDVGAASAIITAAAVVTPLLLARAINGGPLRWLFARPRWARLNARNDAAARLARAG